ncbi:uncharacterized protein [Aristolochia californica]|uniref:uncharacterized protein n=1 Tax=Aristolochia californica TaxID=171875 RepID=UPI0035E34F48
MKAARGEPSSRPYTLLPSRICSEDILFCVDVDLEAMVEMKGSGHKGRVFTRLDSIKQAILLFVHSKLSINPDHRFSLSLLGQSVSRPRKEFSSDIESITSVLRSLSADAAYSHADLTQLFRIAAHEAKKSQAQSRILRVILIYCRSSVMPEHQWPASQKNFSLDVIYLHDKPGPGNCPQKVYDALVDNLEHVSEYEGYIFETGQGLARVLFRQMCVLLAHPQQRCAQDDLDIPKSLTKKVADASPSEDGPTNTSQ